jgi:hypothetical protein
MAAGDGGDDDMTAELIAQHSPGMRPCLPTADEPALQPPRAGSTLDVEAGVADPAGPARPTRWFQRRLCRHLRGETPQPGQHSWQFQFGWMSAAAHRADLRLARYPRLDRHFGVLGGSGKFRWVFPARGPRHAATSSASHLERQLATRLAGLDGGWPGQPGTHRDEPLAADQAGADSTSVSGGPSSGADARGPATRPTCITLAEPRAKLTAERSPAHRAWNGRERRSAGRIKRLSREFNAVCTSAVDAAEIAASLESVGFTDTTAAEYGYEDVFTLADALFQQTPRLVNYQPGRLDNPWVERPLKHLSRGLSFALPGLIFISCLPRVTAMAEFVALTIAMIIGWPAGQTLAYLGYVLEGRRDRGSAQTVLLLGLGAALGVSLAYAVIAMRVGVMPSIAALGAGEIVYMAAASVVLVLGAEWVVLGSLVPGLAAALLSWSGAGPPVVLVGGSAGTVLSIFVSAVVPLVRARRRHALSSLTGRDWREAGWHCAFGVAGALLVTLPALSLTGMAISSLSLLPVIWSMGWAEWYIISLRRQCFDLLNLAISIEFFRLRVQQLGSRSLRRYLGVLAVLTALLLAAIWIITGKPPSVALFVSFSASCILGIGFYLALIVSSLGRVRVVALCMAVAVVVDLVAIETLHWQPAILVGPTLLSLLLVWPAALTIGDPTRHM